MKVALTTWNAEGAGISGRSLFAREYGNSWEVLIDHYMGALWNNQNGLGTEMLMGMLSEAGTPPNPASGTVLTKGTRYNGSINSCTLLDTDYSWYGWSKKAGGKNLRCSLAIMQGLPKTVPAGYPKCTFYAPVDLGALTAKAIDTRPAAGAEFKYSGISFNLNVFLLHLPSGTKQRNLNKSILTALMNHAASYGVPAIIAGDMNIDIGSQTDAQVITELGLGAGWSLLRTHYITQISGGELDWALAYKATSTGANMIGPLMASTGAGRGLGYIAKGISDHAMINYVVDV